MIGNKIADKITGVSKKKPAKELHNNDETREEDVEIATPREKNISPEERKQLIEELSLVPKSMCELRYISPKERQQIIDKLRLV